MGPYVLDFYCPRARLAIEVDGAGHGMGDRPVRDERRDAWLSERGITTLRFAAGDLLYRADEIVDTIERMVRDLCAGAPSTALRAVPLPRCAGEEKDVS
jgi:very-short-patch-repair endonuclease